jgi:hypothetical protein
MAKEIDVQADRQAAVVAASNLVRVSLDEALRRPEEVSGAVVRLAELIEAGYFATPPIATGGTTRPL